MNWSDDDISNITQLTTLHYKDGHTSSIDIDFNQDENISTMISDIYSFGETNDMDCILNCTNMDGMDYMINI